MSLPINTIEVGIIDNGFEYVHEDLASNILNSPGNGGHGTHVAGIMA